MNNEANTNNPFRLAAHNVLTGRIVDITTIVGAPAPLLREIGDLSFDPNVSENTRIRIADALLAAGMVL